MRRPIFYNSILNEKGSTLIEVLVTIFVLTSGLLVLFGMFPQGFNILSNSRQVGFAGSALKDRSAKLEMRKSNMPIAIIPCDDNGNTIDLVNQNPNEGKPDVFTKNNGVYLSDNGTYTRSLLLNCRKVIGESVVIPGGDYYTTANGDFYGGKYTLMFGPIDVTRDSTDHKLKRFVVYGSPMENVESSFASGTYLDMWNDSGYSSYYSDNGDKKLYLQFIPYYAYTRDYSQTLDYNRIYKIKYFVRHLSTNKIFKKEGYIQVNGNYDGEWSSSFPDFDMSAFDSLGTNELLTVGNGYSMLSDSLTVCRVFEEITPGKNFTNDPYQFKMADPIVGTIMFNPLGSKVNLGEDGESEPLKAYIDYMIYDPRITTKDVQFPRFASADTTFKISLGFGGILSVGDPNSIGDGSETSNPDEPTFEGLVRGVKNNDQVELSIGKEATSIDELIISQSLLIIDMETGLRIFPIYAGDDDNPGDIQIDYNNGVVMFRTNRVCLKDWYNNTVVDDVVLTDRNIRFYFRTADDWVVRMCKLPNNFDILENYSTNSKLDWDQCGVVGNRVLFAEGFAGGNVIVSYKYNNKTVYGEIQRISDYPKEGEKCCYVTLKHNPDEIISVEGASVVMGAYWRHGSGFNSRQMLYNRFGN